MKRLFCVISLLFLSSCGFHPIYGNLGNESPVDERMNQIAIANISNREGQVLRNQLIDRMYHHGRPSEPIARLEISLQSSDTSLGLQKDATTTRQEHSLSADYRLKDMNDKVLFSGSARSIVSYSKLSAQYGTLAAQQNASDRSVKDVGEQIINRLSLYLSETPVEPADLK
ncbi:MAG: LPS assembly lipoprotein LptE [Alphaproteobacteria bacterium]|nr:LPS assembly lipoprotein LptE [Alphaproteobacteria bacterium]